MLTSTSRCEPAERRSAPRGTREGGGRPRGPRPARRRSTSTANSSRPRRAIESSPLSTWWKRLPTSCNNASPISRPRVSLTGFETVEVHDEHDELALGVSCLGDGLGEGVAEIDLVGEPRQRIMQGLVADLALEELAAGFWRPSAG